MVDWQVTKPGGALPGHRIALKTQKRERRFVGAAPPSRLVEREPGVLAIDLPLHRRDGVQVVNVARFTVSRSCTCDFA